MNKASGIVRNFRFYTGAQAEQLKKDLRLQMPLSMLAYCASYYTKEKRDPYIEELKMLDSLSGVICQDATSASLKELLTNDSFVADTYADLVQKRKELFPDVRYPCTLMEATKLASDYIHRAGKRLSRGIRPVPEERATNYLSGLGGDCISCEGSAYQFRLLPAFEDENNVDDDYWMLLMPSPQKFPSTFSRQVGEWLSQSRCLSQIKEIYTIGSGGLLHELLKRTPGLWVDLARFVPLGKSATLSVLTCDMSNCRILRVSKQAAENIKQELVQRGIVGDIVARSLPDPQLKISMENNAIFSLSTEFVHSLFIMRPITAKIHKESGTEHLEICRNLVSTENCRYYTKGNPFQICEQKQKDGSALSTAATEPKDSPFLNGLYTALAPITALSIGGHPYSKQILSVALRLPADYEKDERICGDCMAVILGLYRAQSELGIPANEVLVETDEQLPSPNLTVLSTAEGQAALTQWKQEGSNIYCIQIPTDVNGIPDFTVLRAFLNGISSMARNGKILSGTVLVNESITDGIGRMNRRSVICQLEKTNVASSGRLPLAVLLECDGEIDATCIGKTVSKKDSNAEVDTPLFARVSSLIWAEAPQIVVLSKKNDRNAESLCSILNGQGCAVQLFDDDISSSGALSHALLNAWVLVLCPDTKLNESKQISFAADTMKRAGGLVLSLGSKQEAQQQGAIHCPHGISEQMVSLFFPEKE